MRKIFFLVVGAGYPRESPPRKLKFPPGGVRVKRRKREFVSKQKLRTGKYYGNKT